MRARRRERETMVMRNEAGRKKGECHCRCHIATAVAVSMGLVACDGEPGSKGIFCSGCRRPKGPEGSGKGPGDQDRGGEPSLGLFS